MATENLILKVLTDLSGLNKGVSQINSRMDGMKKTFGLVSKVIAGAFVAQPLLDFGREMLDIGKKAQGVRQAFDRLDDKGLLQDLRNAVGSTVGDLQLMQSAVEADKLGIPIQNLATFFEFATVRARELGVESDKLVDSIVKGIGRRSILILDNLGISAVAVREEFKKTGDFAQAVANIVDKEFAGRSLIQVRNFADEWDKLNTQAENFKLAIAEATTGERGANFLRFLSSAVSSLNSMSFAMNQSMKAIEEEQKGLLLTTKTTVDATDAQDKLNDSMRAFKMFLDDAAKSDKEIIKLLKEQAFAAEVATEKQQRLNDELVINKGAVQTIGYEYNLTGNIIKGYTDGIISMNQRLGDQTPLVSEITNDLQTQQEALTETATKWGTLGLSVANGIADLAGGKDFISSMDSIVHSVGALVPGFGSLIPLAWEVGKAIGNLFSGLFKRSKEITQEQVATLAAAAAEGDSNAQSALNVFQALGGQVPTNTDVAPVGITTADTGGLTAIINVSGFVGNDQDLALQINDMLNGNGSSISQSSITG